LFSRDAQRRKNAMKKPLLSQADREHRLNAILLAYVEAVEAGHSPDRQLLMALYPDLASELSEFFEGRDQVEDMSAPLRDFNRSGFVRAALQMTKTPPTQVGGLVSQSSASGQGTTPSTELGQLGDYQLIREIGRGGMGIVYEAHQISLNRRVALKVLPFAAALDPKQLQRFKNEAQAAAQLHHNYIVPVYAVGAERGVHYYAMQYIEGQSLATMIRELRQQTSPRQIPAASSPANDLPSTGPYGGGETPSPSAAAESPTQAVTVMSTERSARSARFYRRVAELGIRAAEALEHAHQEGVVHRDIKPANLLVDVRGNLWITDFGLALFHSDAGLTMTGELLGTLRYMSPEQAMGKRMLVDHRTDIYSLGVTLYELLTLTAVFDGHDRQELLNQIANDEPRPPRSLDKSIPIELETIILKAIAKHPGERYGSVKEMGDDLQCFLEDKPIKARRPSLREKTVKWSRRHRPVVVSAAMLLTLAFIGSVAFSVIIGIEHRITLGALKQKDVALKDAKESFRQARDAVDFITRISEDRLGENVDPQRVRREILQVSLKYYQSFIEQHGDDPSLQAELAASYAKVANLLSDLGADRDALGASENARRMYEKLISEHPSVQEFQDALAAIRQHALYIQGCAQLYWLTEPSVQEDLKLSDAQIQKIAALNKRIQEQGQALWQKSDGLSPKEDRRRLFRAQARANADAIAAILDSDQEKRLRQIGRQTVGSGVFMFFDPDVIARLELTADQIDRFHAIQEQAWKASHDPEAWRTGRALHTDQERVAYWNKMQEKTKETWQSAKEQIVNGLTPIQNSRWKELVGEPFKGEIRMPPPPPRRPGHRTADRSERETQNKP
jgi:serine/threonine protein kinase